MNELHSSFPQMIEKLESDVAREHLAALDSVRFANRFARFLDACDRHKTSPNSFMMDEVQRFRANKPFVGGP